MIKAIKQENLGFILSLVVSELDKMINILTVSYIAYIRLNNTLMLKFATSASFFAEENCESLNLKILEYIRERQFPS